MRWKSWAFCIVAVVVGIVFLPVFSLGTLLTRKSTLERFHEQNVERSVGNHILLITVDALRADHVGLYGYERPTTPRIDEYFSQARIYTNAYSTTASTTPSIMSMLTGKYPQDHGVRLFCQKISPDVITIADHLRRAGYVTGAVVSNAVLADRACGLGERFGDYDDNVNVKEPFRDDMFERHAACTTDDAIRWLQNNRKPGSPSFLWVHYIDPHGPYRPPADKPADFNHSIVKEIDIESVPFYAREPNLTDGNEYIDRYDEEIAYTDREIGRLLDAYENMMLPNNTNVIFTADHGESMMDHEYWFRHQLHVYEEMVRIPLMIRSGRFQQERIDVPVSLIDIAPTILFTASLPVPEDMPGVSLLEPITPRNVMCEGRADGGGLWRGLIHDGVKTVVRHGMSNIIRQKFQYNLIDDPLEICPLPVDDRSEALQILDRFIQSDSHSGGVPREYIAGELPAPDVASGIDLHMHKRLRSLGYISE